MDGASSGNEWARREDAAPPRINREMKDTENLERERAGNYERASALPRKHEGFSLPDNGGRRSGIERRRLSYSAHIPERRSGLDRRIGGKDRRRRKDLQGGDEQALGNRTDAMDPSRNADRRGLIFPIKIP
jgi:hypothetical protein